MICCTSSKNIICVHPERKVHVANMRPTWVLSAPGVPHVGPMSLAVRVGILQVSSPSRRLRLLILWNNILQNCFDGKIIFVSTSNKSDESLTRVFRMWYLLGKLACVILFWQLLQIHLNNLYTITYIFIIYDLNLFTGHFDRFIQIIADFYGLDNISSHPTRQFLLLPIEFHAFFGRMFVVRACQYIFKFVVSNIWVRQ